MVQISVLFSVLIIDGSWRTILCNWFWIGSKNYSVYWSLMDSMHYPVQWKWLKNALSAHWLRHYLCLLINWVFIGNLYVNRHIIQFELIICCHEGWNARHSVCIRLELYLLHGITMYLRKELMSILNYHVLWLSSDDILACFTAHWAELFTIKENNKGCPQKNCSQMVCANLLSCVLPYKRKE